MLGMHDVDIRPFSGCFQQMKAPWQLAGHMEYRVMFESMNNEIYLQQAALLNF